MESMIMPVPSWWAMCKSCPILNISTFSATASATEPVLVLPGYFSKRICGRTQAMPALLRWALIMLLVSLVAALFGFTDIAVASADIARILFYIFLVVFLVLLVLGLAGARAVRGP